MWHVVMDRSAASRRVPALGECRPHGLDPSGEVNR